MNCSRARVLAVGLLGVVLVGCSPTNDTETTAQPEESPQEEGGASPQTQEAWAAALGASLPPRSEWPVRVEAAPACPADGACMAGFLVGGAFYTMSCGRVADEYVTGEVVGDGLHQVNVVDGVEPTMFVAYRDRAQVCDADETPPAGEAWHFAFPEDGDGGPEQSPEQICRVGDVSLRQAEANDC
jgi:hypothetical protein